MLALLSDFINFGGPRWLIKKKNIYELCIGYTLLVDIKKVLIGTYRAKYGFSVFYIPLGESIKFYIFFYIFDFTKLLMKIVLVLTEEKNEECSTVTSKSTKFKQKR